MTEIRIARAGDAEAIAAIYHPHVASGIATFETEPPDAAAIAARMAASFAHPWMVADGDGRVIGYAYAAPFHARAAYRWTVETSIYLAPEAQGRGLGRRLYAALLARAEAAGFVQAIARLTLPNAASVALHQAVGFMPAGLLPSVGYKAGAWRDVGLWQRALARPGDPPREPRMPD